LLFLFVENEKKLVIMALFMKPVVWIEKDVNERQDSKVDDDDDGGRCALLISTFTMAHWDTVLWHITTHAMSCCGRSGTLRPRAVAHVCPIWHVS
jgi:hypothetical protein